MFADLEKMSPAQLRSEMHKHRNGDVAQLLLHAWYPDGLPEKAAPGPRRIMYMCAVDWAHELGEVSSTDLYSSVEALRKARSCVDECGIVMVEVTFNRWIQEGKY